MPFQRFPSSIGFCLLLTATLGLNGCNFRQNKSGGELLDGVIQPTYSSLKKYIFDPKCVTCHSGTHASAGINCSSYRGLIKGEAGKPPIVPGNPEASSLYLACVAGRMPKGMPKLSEPELNAIYSWIKNGAKEGDPEVSPSPSPSATNNVLVLATYDSIRQNIIVPKCLTCHTGPTSPMGKDFSNYVSLIQNSVSPGDAQGSSFYTSTASGSMPRGGPKLSALELAAIFSWIEDGAQESELNPRPSPSPIPVLPNYASLHQRIFAPRCISCHSGPNPPHGIDVTSYEDILNSPVFPALVVRGNPDDSSLYTSCKSGKMPKGASPLSQAELDAIYLWIKNGAKKNESDPTPSPSPSPTEPPDDDDWG